MNARSLHKRRRGSAAALLAFAALAAHATGVVENPAKSFLVTPIEMSIRLDIKLNTTESCTIDAILGGSRL